MKAPWTQYSWDPVTQVATFTDEKTGLSFEVHQPIKATDLATYFNQLQHSLTQKENP